MRLLSIFALLATYFVFSPGSDGQKPTAGQTDISRSGSNFLEACSSIDSGGNKSSVQINNEATCLGWVGGFEDGFTVRDELLGVPEKDRIVCMPHGVTTLQIVRIIKKYLAVYPEKARRPTRYIASIALARAFPCRAGK